MGSVASHEFEFKTKKPLNIIYINILVIPPVEYERTNTGHNERDNNLPLRGMRKRKQEECLWLLLLEMP